MRVRTAKWDEDALYLQFLQRDRVHDGKFLTGVISTGIYCLPSCPARRPKRENVRFFHDPAEARSSGLRPCYRCRPDSFYRGEEFHESLFEQTAARVRTGPAAFHDIARIARAAGLSRTALNDLFREHTQESPGAFLRRVRVESVCQSLEKGAKAADAAASAGFESASAFHEQFSARTGLTPAAYASLGRARQFTLRLPAGYRTREVLDFFGRDKESVSERVHASGFSKCFAFNDRAILVDVAFQGNTAVCSADTQYSHEAHRAIVRMLGLDSDAASFERQFAGDELLGGLLQRQQGLRIPLTPEPWEALGWAIIRQQISLKAAVALRRGLIARLGLLHNSGLRAFPTARAVAETDVETLRQLKFSASKAEYLLAAARAVASGDVPLHKLRELSAHHAARMLSAIRGVGPWTVQYVFLRGAGFADCLPAGDAGLARGLAQLAGQRPDESAIKELLGRFAPFRSLAACHVWASLSTDSKDKNHDD